MFSFYFFTFSLVNIKKLFYAIVEVVNSGVKW